MSLVEPEPAGLSGTATRPQLSPRNKNCIRQDALQKLVANVRSQGYIPTDGSPAAVMYQGRSITLPAYVPYIGPRYFWCRPRVLCYAINQNLSRHAGWTHDWTREWAADVSVAHDRLNCSAERGQALPIRPYAEGFIPFLALVALASATPRKDRPLPNCIDDVVACTNFVKFSTAADADSSSIPSDWWRQSRQRYVGLELQTLKPDIVLTFGGRTYRETLAALDEARRLVRTIVLPCRFPARIPSDTARPLTSDEEENWRRDFAPLLPHLGVPKRGYHQRRVERYRGYFLDVTLGWQTALGHARSAAASRMSQKVAASRKPRGRTCEGHLPYFRSMTRPD